MSSIATVVAALIDEDSRSPYTTYGVSYEDRGASYYDSRYGLTFTKFDSGMGIWGYHATQGATIPVNIVKSVLDTDATGGFTDPSKYLGSITIPGGTLVHNNKLNLSILAACTLSGSPSAFAGTFRLQLAGFNTKNQGEFSFPAGAGNTVTIAGEYTAEDCTTLLIKAGGVMSSASGAPVTNPKGGTCYTRLINLLADLTINIYFTPSASTGKLISLVSGGITYTTVSNTSPTGGVSYRDPRDTPYRDESFWNVHLPSGTTYANPATDQSTLFVRDQFAGKLDKSGGTTNYKWVAGQSNDGVPIHPHNAASPICLWRINNVSTGHIVNNTPIGQSIYYLQNGTDYTDSEVYLRMRVQEAPFIDGQSSDHVMAMRSGDGRLTFETGRYKHGSTVWKASDDIFQFDTVLPTNYAQRKYQYYTDNNGNLGTVDNTAAWPQVLGQTVVDNGITWKCIANSQLPFAINTPFLANTYVIPTAAVRTKFQYLVSADGISGATEPVWPTTIGATVTSGTLTFTCTADTLNNSGLMHTSNTLFTSDIFGYGYSKKNFPWYTTNEILVGQTLNAYKQFHRAGGLPLQGGLVKAVEIASGYIPHVIAMQASGIMLRANTFTVVSAINNGSSVAEFVIRCQNATYNNVDYTELFPAGQQFGHAGNTSTINGNIYTVATSTFDPVTGYTKLVATTPYITNASTVLVWGGTYTNQARLASQFQWPNNNADSSASGIYFGVTPLGAMFAIPKSTDITTLGLTAEGLILAKALQDFGGITVDYTGTTFAVCQIEKGISSTVKNNLVTDKTILINNLVRVTNYDRALVQAGIAEGLLAYQKPIVPFY